VYLEPSARVKHVRTQSWEGQARQGRASIPMAGSVPRVQGRSIPRTRQSARGIGVSGTSTPRVVARAAAEGDGDYCGSRIERRYERIPESEGGGAQICDYLVVCLGFTEDGLEITEETVIPQSCTGNILE
jgi:hypothetical protein